MRSTDCGGSLSSVEMQSACTSAQLRPLSAVPGRVSQE